jgi:hypothetical protein
LKDLNESLEEMGEFDSYYDINLLARDTVKEMKELLIKAGAGPGS